MKAMLQFALPDEQDAFEVAQNGWKYRAALSEFDELLRGIVKYGNSAFAGPLDEQQWEEAADRFRRSLHSILDEEGVSLY